MPEGQFTEEDMSEDPVGAILQRDEKTYAIVPRTPVGLLTPDDLERIAAVARRYHIPIIKLTSGQRLALVGIQRDDVDRVWQDLGMDVGKATELCLHYVQACPGTEVCKYGLQDSLGLGREIEAFFLGMDLPAKVKIGVSGCPFCCGESFVRDIGVFGKKSGWSLVVGGSSARRPRIGDLIREELTAEQVTSLTRRVLEYYRDNARKRERLARFVDRIGIEEVKDAVFSGDDHKS
jgi:NAD(P)H-nitrite reductase large subunit